MCVRATKTKSITKSPLYIYILSLRYSIVFQLDNIVEEERTSIHTILNEVIGESENEAIWSNGRMTCWTSRTKPIRAITHIDQSMVKSSIQECVVLIDLIQRGFYTPLANQHLLSLIAEQAVASIIGAPVAAPIEAPIAEPIEAPVASPIAEPIAEPIEAPIAAPIVEPIEAPIVEPIEAPIEAPITAPIADEFLKIEREEQILNRVLNEVDIEERQKRTATAWNVISYISRNALFYY